MKRLEYSNPKVEVIKWEKHDIITTSGGGSRLVTMSEVSSMGDSNVTCSVKYEDLK